MNSSDTLTVKETERSDKFHFAFIHVPFCGGSLGKSERDGVCGLCVRACACVGWSPACDFVRTWRLEVWVLQRSTSIKWIFVICPVVCTSYMVQEYIFIKLFTKTSSEFWKSLTFLESNFLSMFYMPRSQIPSAIPCGLDTNCRCCCYCLCSRCLSLTPRRVYIKSKQEWKKNHLESVRTTRGSTETARSLGGNALRRRWTEGPRRGVWEGVFTRTAVTARWRPDPLRREGERSHTLDARWYLHFV